MITLQVELPERLAQSLRELVQEGWFASEQEIVRVALLEFLQRSHRQLAEQFMLEDIEWAKRLRQETE